jgi:MFS family permease
MLSFFPFIPLEKIMQQVSATKSGFLFSTRLSILYALSFLFGTALGLFNPLMSTFMEQQQVSRLWIGVNSTVYFLAIAIGTPIVENLLRQIGIRRILLVGLSLMALSAPLFPLTTQLGVWFSLRIVMGLGVCCVLVGGQTALNSFSHESNRSQVSGLYFLAMGLGFILGPAIGPRFYNISPQLAFLLGGGVVLSALALIWCSLPQRLTLPSPSRPFFFHLLKKLKFPIHGVFSYGLAEATLIALYPVFLLNQNYSVEQMGYTLSVFVIGSLLSTFPVTLLADRFGKVRMLSISICIGLIASVGLVVFDSYQLILFFSLLAGASIGPVYPICLALLGEQISKEELAAGIALFTTTYCLGNAAGPLLSSLMMEVVGSRHIFSACIPIYVFLLVRMGWQERKLFQPKSTL